MWPVIIIVELRCLLYCDRYYYKQTFECCQKEICINSLSIHELPRLRCYPRANHRHKRMNRSEFLFHKNNPLFCVPRTLKNCWREKQTQLSCVNATFIVLIYAWIIKNVIIIFVLIHMHFFSSLVSERFHQFLCSLCLRYHNNFNNLS